MGIVDETRESFIRTEMLLGGDALARLRRAHVAVVGLGGVGGYAVEALARSGVGELTLLDSDCVSRSNLNRQILATRDTVGQPKAELAAARVKAIYPDCIVHPLVMRYDDTTREQFFAAHYDHIADCIDLVKWKIDLIVSALSRDIPILSAMGTGNRIDPFSFRITDLAKTEGCPLARILRRELRKRGVLHTTVLYSPDPALKPRFDVESDPGRRTTPASCAWVPSCAGLMMAGHIVQSLAASVE